MYVTHNHWNTPTYWCWANMKSRCLNKNHESYQYYGGRGITVCKEWLTFEGFFADMGEKPKGLTLERKENDKGYCKENCVWATQAAQVANRRNPVLTKEILCVIKDMYYLFRKTSNTELARIVSKEFNVSEETVRTCIRHEAWRKP